MTPDEAREIIAAAGYVPNTYVRTHKANSYGGLIKLNGHYRAEELEAIAVLMRVVPMEATAP